MRVVYIAGKFRGATPWQVQQNVRAAEEAALAVWRMGLFALCPHKNTEHFDKELADDVFVEGTKEMLRRCDAVLLVPGWTASVGARGEAVEAQRLGLPIFGGFATVGPGGELVDPEETPLVDALAALAAWARRAPGPHAAMLDEVRQRLAGGWARQMFGHATALHRVERGLRVLEEAAELAQALGVDAEAARRVVERVQGRPAGDPVAELGGVRLASLVAAEALGVSAREVEANELARVRALDPGRLRIKHASKVAEGVAVDERGELVAHEGVLSRVLSRLGRMPVALRDFLGAELYELAAATAGGKWTALLAECRAEIEAEEANDGNDA